MIDIAIKEINNRNDILINKLLEIWENSVINTHLFLTREEINNIKKYVIEAILKVKHLIILEKNNNIIAFMGINDQKLEMLFIKNNERKKGYGKLLLNYGIKKYQVNELTVNEQNEDAKLFYEHLGFKTYKRSEIDEEGNPYPILYMTNRR